MSVSLRDIAKLAGVSAATVSRVLGDPAHRTASPGTAERIWRIAREHNYIPNQAAQALKRGGAADSPAATYLDVLMTRSGRRQSNPFFNELLRMVELEAHRRAGIVSNVWYETAFADDRRSRRADVERLLANAGGGDKSDENDGGGASSSGHEALVVIGRCNREVLKALADRYRAVVSINRSTCSFAVDEVTCDGARIAAVSVDYLVGLGHRHIGYAGVCQSEPRYRGFQEALIRHGLMLDPAAIVDCEPTEAAARSVFTRLMRCEELPTAVVCGSDTLALGLMRQLELQGHRYWRPSLVGCDDIEECQLVRPMLTTVGMSKQDMAHVACGMLFDRLAGGHRAPLRVEVECRLMARESCFRVSGSDNIEYII